VSADHIAAQMLTFASEQRLPDVDFSEARAQLLKRRPLDTARAFAVKDALFLSLLLIESSQRTQRKWQTSGTSTSNSAARLSQACKR